MAWCLEMLECLRGLGPNIKKNRKFAWKLAKKFAEAENWRVLDPDNFGSPEGLRYVNMLKLAKYSSELIL